MQIRSNGISLEVERRGDQQAPAIVLIRGLGTQLIYWPDSFLTPFVSAGFQLILFDNRDVGLSEKLDQLGHIPPTVFFKQVEKGENPAPPYTLDDMACDVAGLIDAIDLKHAHILGISLGGAVAQTVAERFPEKTLSLTSIMSTSSNPDLPKAKPEVWATLLSPPTDASDRVAKVEDEAQSMLITGSPDYPITLDAARTLAARAYDRCYHPAGVDRQMLALRSAGDRRSRLARIVKPTYVLHGACDPLILPECGRDTARHIPGAKFEEIPGMGHDISPSLGPILAEKIIGFLQNLP